MTANQPHPDILRIGVLLSGSGTTLENLILRIADGRLRNVAIGLVVSSRADAGGLERARDARLAAAVVPAAAHDAEAFSNAITARLDAARIDLVVLAGFLWLWRFPPRYAGRVINVHPALLPAFGGPGMYGHHVHQAVLRAGVRESGCTVHIADHEYDHGPIIAQRRVPVLADDTPDSLAARVQAAERELYPEVIQHVADRGLDWLRTVGV